MSTCLFWANWYPGEVVEQIYFKSGGDVAITRQYTTLFNIILPLGVFVIPLFGWATDRAGFVWSIVLTSFLAITFSLCSMVESVPLQILSFISYAFFRTALFSLLFAYIAKEFGYKYFGILSGIILGVGGCIGFVQIPLHAMSPKFHHYYLVYIQFGMIAVSPLFAIYEYFNTKKKNTQHDAQL